MYFFLEFIFFCCTFVLHCMRLCGIFVSNFFLKSYKNPCWPHTVGVSFLYEFMNTGQIIKSRSREIPYTQISNEILRSTELTIDEKGLLCYLLSLPYDWVLYKSSLHVHLNEKKNKIDRVFKSLQAKGYVLSVKQVDALGRFCGWNHVVYHEPTILPRIENSPTSKKPELGETMPIQKKDYIQKKDIQQKEYILVENENFEQFWNMYDRKEGKQAAMREWDKLTPNEQALVLEHAKKYVAARAKLYRAKPEKYLREKMFYDDIVQEDKPELIPDDSVRKHPSYRLFEQKIKENPIMVYGMISSSSQCKELFEMHGLTYDFRYHKSKFHDNLRK